MNEEIPGDGGSHGLVAGDDESTVRVQVLRHQSKWVKVYTCARTSS